MRTTIDELCSILHGSYPKLFPLTDHVLEAWHAVMAEADPVAAKAAVLAWIRAGKEFPPNPGQVLKEIKLATLPGADQLRKSAAEAWGEALVPGTLACTVALSAGAIFADGWGGYWRASEQDARNHREQWFQFRQAWEQLQDTGYGLERYLGVAAPAAELNHPDHRRLECHASPEEPEEEPADELEDEGSL